MTAWARYSEGVWILEIHLQPGAKTSEVAGEQGGRLKIKISAPPVDNAANEALLEFIAKTAGVAKSRVKLMRGHTSRLKTVRVDAQEGCFLDKFSTVRTRRLGQ